MDSSDGLDRRLTEEDRRIIRVIGGYLNRLLLGDLDEVPTTDRRDEFGILLNLVARVSRELKRARAQEALHRGELEQKLMELEATHERQAQLLVERLKELATAHEAQARLLGTVRELSSPILAVHRGVLLVPLIGELDPSRAEHMTTTLLARIVEFGAQIVILDVTGVPAIDAEVAGLLLRAGQAAGLLGARAILSGVSPAVARVAVELDLDLASLNPCGDLQGALARALDLLGSRSFAPQPR